MISEFIEQLADGGLDEMSSRRRPAVEKCEEPVLEGCSGVVFACRRNTCCWNCAERGIKSSGELFEKVGDARQVLARLSHTQSFLCKAFVGCHLESRRHHVGHAVEVKGA